MTVDDPPATRPQQIRLAPVTTPDRRRHERRRQRPHGRPPFRRRVARPDVAFVAFLAGVAAVRYAMLIRTGAPPTIDAGNWLAFGQDLLGDDVRAGSVYPPVVPMLVVGTVGIVGPLHGVALVGAVASVAPAVGVYVVLREHGLRWPAFILAALLAPATATGEATAWGGYPQLLGTGLAFWFLARLDRALRTTRRRDALAAGAVLAVTLATSHLAAAFAMGAGGLLAVGHLCRRIQPPPPHRWRRAVVIALVAVPALPLIPIYASIAGGLLGRSGGAVVSRLGPADLPDQLEYLYRDLAIPWRALLLAGLAVVALLVDQRRSPLWLVATSSFAAAVALALAAGEPRFLYLVPPAAIIAVGLWWTDVAERPGLFFRRARIVAGALLAVTCAAQTVTGLARFPAQRAYYGILSPGTVAAIHWLGTETPPGSLVAVSPVREAPLGWWVEGLGRRSTIYASPLRWLNFPDEQQRARLANRVFAPTFPRPGALGLACRHGVDYILVDKSWGGYDAPAIAEVVDDGAEEVAFENEDAVVLVPRCG